MGYGVCPSQIFETTSRAAGSSSSAFLSKAEYEEKISKMEEKMKENDEKMKSMQGEMEQKMEESNSKMKIMEYALTYVLQQMGGTLPSGFPNFNQAEDLGSLAQANVRRRGSSEDSHEQQNHGSSSPDA